LHDQQLAGVVMIGEQLAALGLCSWFLLRAQISRTAPAKRLIGSTA